MSIALEWSSLSKSQKDFIKQKIKCQTPITKYQPRPKVYRLYEIDEENDTVYLPIYMYKKFFSKFPTTIKDYPQTLGTLPNTCILYTPETDPDGKNRDQVGVVREAIQQFKDHHSCFISADTSYGKCFGRGTKILTYSRGVVSVEDIMVGDCLLSGEEKLTYVTNTTSGVDIMYEIELAPFEKMQCNEDHILTLYRFDNPEDTLMNTEYDVNRTQSMTLKRFLRLSSERRACYKTLIRANMDVPFDTTYFTDTVWEITLDVLNEINLQVYSDDSKLSNLRWLPWQFRDEVFWQLVNKLSYREHIDFIIARRNTYVLKQFFLLSRSLGYACWYESETQLRIRSTKRYYHALYSPKIRILGVDQYFGFSLSPHRHFLLESYTVAHNTQMGVYLALTHKVPTAIICHAEIVRNQWVETIRKITRNEACIQTLVGKQKVEKNAHFYVVGIEKATHYEKDDFDHVGFVIVDEAHLCTIKAFTKTLHYFQPLYLLALSATPERSDGMHCIFKYYFKDFIIRKQPKDWYVYKIKTSFKPTVEYIQSRGKSTINWPLFVSSLENNPERWKFIVNLTQQYKDKIILILCNRVEHTKNLHRLICEIEPAALLVGNLKPDMTKRITCCGMKKGGVGMDDKRINMIILASDAKDVEQYVGRIRQASGIILDIVDSHSLLEKHWYERRQFYLSKEAKIPNDNGVENDKVLSTKLIDGF